MRLVVPSLDGVATTFLPVLRHILGRIARDRAGRLLSRASRAEEIPHRVSRDIRPLARQLGHYLALTDGKEPGWVKSAILPPLYPTIWMLAPSLDLLSDPLLDLSLLGVIHARNDLISHRPIRRTEPTTLDISVESLHRDEERALISVRCDCLVGGQLALEMHTALVSGLSPVGAPREPPAPARPGHDWRSIRRVALGRGHPLRYALLSGDVNPVHLSGPTSRLFGFPQPILHGFCLKSIIAHALVRCEGGGDLSTLRRLRLSFRYPVSPPATLDIQVRGSKVRVISSDGRLVFADGQFRIGPPEDPLKDQGT